MSSVLPLRPLTTGELLDAAVMLLRQHGKVLVPVAVVLAALEQAVLFPLRTSLGTIGFDPDEFLASWLLFAVGAGTEMTALALLGGLTARAAGAAVLGTPVSGRDLLRPRGGRFAAVAFVAVGAGALTFFGALLVPFWIVAYAAVGLMVPVLVVDRLGVGRAVARGMGLAWRNGARAAGVRLLGYLAWLAIRIALGLGGLALAENLMTDNRSEQLLATLTWLAVNAVVYPSLACLDAVLHLETRMRTEGLDIWLSRAARHGPLAPHLLVVHR